jgi:hypothetical protein
MALKPRKPVTSLDFDLVGGGHWSLEEDKPEKFTMIVFTAATTARSAAATRPS